MLTEDKVLHSLGVARKCYQLALDRGHDIEFAKQCFLMGWCHDIGYEFNDFDGHASFSSQMIHLFGCTNYNLLQAVRCHSNPIDNDNEYWTILTSADLQVDSTGKECTVEERLEDIKVRHGKISKQYENAVKIAKKVNLVEEK